MVKHIGIMFVVSCLSGCLFTGDKKEAGTDFYEADKLSSLKDLGDEGGVLVLGVVDKEDWHGNIQLPRVEKSVDERQEVSLSIGDFVRRSFFGERVNPAMEFGAMYYIPLRHNKEGVTGKVIEKLCSVVDGHDMDDVSVLDWPSGITKDKRKLVLDGAVDVGFLSELGISANAEVKYLFELEVNNVRKRLIGGKDARGMKKIILLGPRCKNEFTPQVEKREKFQLVSAYYGELIIKQAYEFRGQGEGKVGIAELEMKTSSSSQSEKVLFVFFKIFVSPIAI